MAYTPKGYTTKTSIEDYMQIDIDDSFNDKINEWIVAAEEIIDQETNRDWTPGPATNVKIYDGDGTNTLLIDPISNVTGVSLYIGGDSLDTNQYYLYPANQLIKNKIKLRYLSFPEGMQNITITGSYGSGIIQAQIRHVATVIVAGMINYAWSDESEIQSMSVGRYSVTYKSTSQKDDFANIQDILDRNKRYSF